MNSSDITQHIAEAKEALGGFLGTLLGEEVVFQIEAPESVSLEEAALDTIRAVGGAFGALWMTRKSIPCECAQM